MRKYARHMARLHMEQAGIRRCVKSEFFRKHWREYIRRSK